MLVARSSLILNDPRYCRLPGSCVLGIVQARIMEWVAICCSEGSSRCRDWTWVFCTAGRFFTIWAIKKATHIYIYIYPIYISPAIQGSAFWRSRLFSAQGPTLVGKENSRRQSTCLLSYREPLVWTCDNIDGLKLSAVY